jgi:hypothetical protein
VDLGVLVDRDVDLAGHDVLRGERRRHCRRIVAGEARRALDGDGQAVLVGNLVLELAVDELAGDERVLDAKQHRVRVFLR